MLCTFKTNINQHSLYYYLHIVFCTVLVNELLGGFYGGVVMAMTLFECAERTFRSVEARIRVATILRAIKALIQQERWGAIVDLLDHNKGYIATVNHHGDVKPVETQIKGFQKKMREANMPRECLSWEAVEALAQQG